MERADALSYLPYPLFCGYTGMEMSVFRLLNNWPGLKYLYSYWIDCHEILYKTHATPRDKF